jgi:aromatic ring-opening dioxygenase catalytic subunit (LigB family)
VVILISPDHQEAFGLENLPVFAIGSAQTHRAIREHGIPVDDVAGAPLIAQALHGSLLAQEFDVAIAHEMPLDHGFLVPVKRLGLQERRVVPVHVSCNNPPLPTLNRCRALGLALRRAIDGLPEGTVVAVLGLGALSHWVAVPRMGEINEEWDRRVLDRLEAGDLDSIAAMTDDEILEDAGNGALEIRTWLVAAACAGGRARTVAYAPMRSWVTGIGVTEFDVAR